LSLLAQPEIRPSALVRQISRGAQVSDNIRLGDVLPVAYQWEWLRSEWRTQADLIREIFGNPFRPITLGSAWRTSNVVALAEAIYQDRAFERMPILADALEDAGCDRQDVLQHCRSGESHVLGCWVVDAVLGKT
jgi:hypothetical protein